MASKQRIQPPAKTGEESEFEFVDVPGASVQLTSMITNLQSAPVIVRAGAATIPGIMSGYIAMKASKAAALGFGGGLLILFIANHYGLVTIHWDKITSLFDQQKESVQRTESLWRTMMQKLRNSTKNNPALLAGFVSGFLIGLAYA